MKKSIKYLTIAALAASVMVSCQYGEDEVSNPVDKAPAIAITVNEVGDDACSFTVAPSGTALYYSYSVVEGNVFSAPDAAKLYSVSAGGIKKGTVKYAETPSATISLSGLDCNADYTVFAVAGSPEGVPGEVAIQHFHTTDTVNPEVVDAAVEDGSLVLTFSEPVKFVVGKEVTVEAYAPASYSYQHYRYAAEPEASFVIKSGETDGNSVVLPIPEDAFVPGALLAVSYPDGTFIDAVELPIEGQESYVFGNYYTSEGWYPETYGIVIETEPDSFELGDELDLGDITAIDDGEDYVPVLIFPLGEGIGYYLDMNYGYLYETYDWDDDYTVGTVTYSQVTADGRKSTKTIKLGYGEDAEYDLIELEDGIYGCVYLYEEPLPGDTVTVVLPPYCYVDKYGNVNAEKTYTFTYVGSSDASEGE